MGTKFHHYGLVVLPGAAMMAGLWLDERLGEASSRSGRARSAATGALFIVAALLVIVIARDLTAASNGDGPSGAARFVQLMTYRYDRRWPAAEAFGPAIIGVATLTSVASIGLAVPAWRRRGLLLFAASSVSFGLVLLDGYLVRAAPDGGQRGVFEAYYRARGSEAAAPLVAYQLNWKGENFYSGNNVALFIASGAPMRAYLDGRKQRGESTVYFVTERSCVSGLRSELGAVRSFAELTPPSVSHEFSLVRAEL